MQLYFYIFLRGIANKLYKMSPPYLAIAVAVMAMPLTDPAMCAGEELFINNDVAVNEQLVMVFWGMMITNRRVHNKDEELHGIYNMKIIKKYKH